MKLILPALEKFELPIVLPLHPRTKSRLDTFNIEPPANVQAIAPVGYLDMVMLEQNALLIATDSGGVQKEAFFYRVPCVTLRHETEWTELLQAGWNRLAPPDNADNIFSSLQAAAESRGSDITPYGEGRAGEKIVNHIAHASVD